MVEDTQTQAWAREFWADWNRNHPGLDRERLGRRVREIWVEWAERQPGVKLSWVIPWDDLTENEQEVDRRIGEVIARETVEMFLQSTPTTENEEQAFERWFSTASWRASSSVRRNLRRAYLAGAEWARRGAVGVIKSTPT